MVAGLAMAGGQKGSESSKTSGGKVSLKYWDMLWSDDANYEPTVKNLAAEFSKQTGIPVTVQIIPWNNHYQTFVTAINAGNAPDISTGGAFQAIQYAGMGQTLDLGSIIEEWKKEGSPVLDDFVPGSLELQRYNGVQVGIPWNTDVREMYYRTDYLASAGYSGKAAYESHTWDEFLNILRAVKKAKPNVIPFAFNAGDYTATHVMMSFAAANDTGMTDVNGKADLNSPKFIEVLKFFGTCVAEGLVPRECATYLSSDIQRLYASGNIAVVWGANPTYLNDYNDVRTNTDIMEATIGPSGKKPLNLVWTNPILGFNQTKYPNETKQFIKWWIENNKDVYIKGKTGSLPVRRSFFADPYYTTNWLSSLIVKRKLLDTASSPVYPSPIIYAEAGDIEGNNYFGQPLQRVLIGETNYTQIASQANAQIAEALTMHTNKK
jgi:ABC-type glycerol-3-phosphate transport system substrate-binding protein